MQKSIQPNKKVLFIAYYFPPCGGGGVQRPTKFVKYLRQFNWEPVVLTATTDSFVETDKDIMNDLPEDLVIERVRPLLSRKQTHKIRNKMGVSLPIERTQKKMSFLATLARWLRHWIMIPDSQVFWVIPAAFKLRKILAKHQPDVIFATGPPFSTFLLAVLSKRLTKRPLVSDFRDPWSEYFQTLRSRESGFRKKIEGFLEKKVIQTSDCVICPTPGMISYFKDEVCQNSNKYHLIYNGFDDEDFSDIIPQKFNNFTIVYTGEVNSTYHSAVPFLKALRELIGRRPALREQIEVHFVGDFNDEQATSLIKAFDINQNIILNGYLPHVECLSYQMGADILLLLLNSNTLESITGKVFEYLRTKKQILALVPENGMAADLLRNIGAGLIIPPNETGRIASELENLISSSKKTITGKFQINKFSRKSQTKELATIFDELISD